MGVRTLCADFASCKAAVTVAAFDDCEVEDVDCVVESDTLGMAGEGSCCCDCSIAICASCAAKVGCAAVVAAAR